MSRGQGGPPNIPRHGVPVERAPSGASDVESRRDGELHHEQEDCCGARAGGDPPRGEKARSEQIGDEHKRLRHHRHRGDQEAQQRPLVDKGHVRLQRKHGTLEGQVPEGREKVGAGERGRLAGGARGVVLGGLVGPQRGSRLRGSREQGQPHVGGRPGSKARFHRRVARSAYLGGRLSLADQRCSEKFDWIIRVLPPCPSIATASHSNEQRQRRRMARSSISGWSALVTGGSMGIGFECARALVRDGCTVTLVARRPDRLAQAVELLQKEAPEGTGVFSVECDVTDEETVKGAVRAAFVNGGDKLHVVVHSAGGSRIQDGDAMLLPRISLEGWKYMLDLNVTSFFLIVKHSAPYLARTAASLAVGTPLRPPTTSIVAISSVNSVRTTKYHGSYAVTKSAVCATVRAAAADLGSYGIRVNSVMPGLMPTELSAPFLGTPLFRSYTDNQILKRVGDVGDPADLVRFLAGPESSWITGESISVDGGQHVYGGGVPEDWELFLGEIFGDAAKDRITMPEIEP
ncbi:hypothetical protein DFJ74DRAFT_453905 [Hyaloraphidium curvatum]|nr:hypothetical protein DFJ74DRAFT_453905 [Hyaloraphidium curvatum]